MDVAGIAVVRVVPRSVMVRPIMKLPRVRSRIDEISGETKERRKELPGGAAVRAMRGEIEIVTRGHKHGIVAVELPLNACPDGLGAITWRESGERGEFALEQLRHLKRSI